MNILRQSSDFNLTEQIVTENHNFPRALLKSSQSFHITHTLLAVYWFSATCTRILFAVFTALFTYFTINVLEGTSSMKKNLVTENVILARA